MPSYDLICKDCGYKFSVFCSISARDKQTCPQCQSSNLSQRFTAVNIGGRSTSDNSCSAGSSRFG